MNMQEVRERAKKFDIKTGGMKKADLIRIIQTEEGNTPCFQNGVEECDQTDCCWMDDCLLQ